MRSSVARHSGRKSIRNPRRDQRVFSRTAGMVHKVNSRKRPMRGGYRI